MAHLRKFVAYRRMERPYTRFSKYKNLNFVHSRPVSRVVRYTQGEQGGKFDYNVNLVSKARLQIRDNAIESARLSVTRLLEGSLPKNAYHFLTRIYPHHVLRENPLASGAGADRMSTGMAHSFGKPIGVAAQVPKGKSMLTIRVNEENLPVARKALKRASYKLPCACKIVAEKAK